MRILRTLLYLVAVCLAVSVANAQSWTKAPTFPGSGAGAAWLMTDGTVIVHEEQGGAANWHKLTPNINGSYAAGTWSKIASPPGTYSPVFFASAVLPDGRLIIEGGEYNNGCPNGCWVKLGAIYDPRTGQWQSVSPPNGWSTIGDAQSVVLSNGKFMLANCCSTQEALLNPTTLTWTATGTGKHDENDEEGWTLLPNGKVLTVDAYVSVNSCGGNMATELYTPSAGSWVCGPSTTSQEWDSTHNELGPAVLRPDGTVFQAGAIPATSIYNYVTNTWTAGPSFPGTYDIADGPAALEINGKVLLMTSPGVFLTGAVFFEWDGTTLTQITGPPNAPSDSSFYGHMLVLPTGKILFTDYSTDVELFGSAGTFNAAWRPTITSFPATVTHGHTNYTVMGLRFSGMSQGAAYGDDYQSATNYALVRLTNVGTKHVFYARTHNQNSYQVQSATTQSTMFDVPSNTELGPTTLEVVTNGIPSVKQTITVN
jgi:hypothetical protein